MAYFRDPFVASLNSRIASSGMAMLLSINLVWYIIIHIPVCASGNTPYVRKQTKDNCSEDVQ